MAEKKAPQTRQREISINWGTPPTINVCNTPAPVASAKSFSWLWPAIVGLVGLVLVVMMLKNNGATTRNILSGDGSFIGDKTQKVLIDKDGNVVKDIVPPVVTPKKKSSGNSKNSVTNNNYDYSVKDSYNTNPVEKVTETTVEKVVETPPVIYEPEKKEPMKKKEERSRENMGPDESDYPINQ